MDKLRQALNLLKQGINNELRGIKKLKGKKKETFKEVFNIEDDFDLFYNHYNLVILDPLLHEKLGPFFRKDSLVIKIEVPEHNINCWVYQYFNDQIFESYLEDTYKRPD